MRFKCSQCDLECQLEMKGTKKEIYEREYIDGEFTPAKNPNTCVRRLDHNPEYAAWIIKNPTEE